MVMTNVAARVAVGYLRRSTDRQEQSIEDQRKAIQQYAAANGFNIERWYVDDAISGANADSRRDFLKMVADAQLKGRAFDTIIVYDVKRFGRLDNDETGHYRYLLSQAGVEVIYASENFSGDDSDDLLRPVKQWQARQELKDLSKVTIRGSITRSEGGWWMGGTPPYGYDLAYYSGRGDYLMTARFLPHGGKQVLDEAGNVKRTLGPGDSLMASKEDRAKLVLSAPDRVQVVKDIYDWYVRDGLGFRSIADRLNRKGVPSPGRRAGIEGWNMATVRSILMNPAYTGDMVWNRRSTGKFHVVSRRQAVPVPKIRRHAVEKQAEANWIRTRDRHPAVVTRDLYEQAQAKRRVRSETATGGYRHGRGAKSDFLLSGLLRCAHCGHNWQGYTVTKGKRRDDGTKVKTLYYACGGYVTKGTSICERSLIRKDMVEEFLFDEVGRSLSEFLNGDEGRQMLRKALLELMGPEANGAGERKGFLVAKADIEQKIYNIIDNTTPTTREFADKRIEQLKAELDAIERQVERVDAQAANAVDLTALEQALLDYMKRFEVVQAEGTVEEKRAFLRAFTRTVELDPETGKGRLEIYSLPMVPVQEKKDSQNGHPSSLTLVAGVGFEPTTSGL